MLIKRGAARGRRSLLPLIISTHMLVRTTNYAGGSLSLLENRELIKMGVIVEREEESPLKLVMGSKDVYINLTSRQRKAILRSLVWAAIIIISSAILMSFPDERWPIYWRALKHVYLLAGAPVILGIVLSILDRIGVLFPVESKIHNQISALERIVEEVRSDNKGLMQQLSDQAVQNREDFDKAIEELTNYDKYSISRAKFGLNALVGVDQHKGVSDPDVETREEFFVIRLLTERKAAKIQYLTSFINNTEMYIDAIKVALARGVEVEVLLMNPAKTCSLVRARWVDCFHREFNLIDEFVDDIKQKYDKLAHLAQQSAHEKEKNSRRGEFKLKTYESSLNHPMILVWENKQEPMPAVAYTGFYLGDDSGKLPFIEWRGGDFRMLHRLKKLFEDKWDGVGDRTLS